MSTLFPVQVRVHEDGRVAVLWCSFEDGDMWMVHAADMTSHIVPVTGVSGPGWRDAAIVPLPPSYPDQPIWEVGSGMVSADCPEVFIDDRPLVPAQARQYAAALLAAADEVDRQQLAEGCAATHEIERQGGDQP